MSRTNRNNPGFRSACTAGTVGLSAAALTFLAALSPSCLDSKTRRCSWGLTCPPGKVCDEAHRRCVLEEQFSACEGLGEGDACHYGGTAGACKQGVCLDVDCGNGYVEAGEVCDDGNKRPGDGCSADCLSDETCGNAITDPQAGEECDCGDGSGDLPDVCQAPNGDPVSHCSGNCRIRYCSNGIVDPGEACDDGNLRSGDGCRGDCQSDETCGNGQVDFAAAESCDDGNNLPGDGCGAACKIEGCGNGIVDPGEICDDGNNLSNDGCRADCNSNETCGNGIADLSAGELCDCSNDPLNPPAGCDAPNGDPASHCSFDCMTRYCGNNTVDPGEVCDDGNHVAGDDCSPDCKSDETCGNGITDFAAGETCDCGNHPSLKPAYCAGINGDPAGDCTVDCLGGGGCGDSVVDAWEVCDDGNNVSGDGCSSDCQSDETCGNGLTDMATGETCDDGNTAAGDGCGSTCRIEFCGNGIADPGEVCDDGNNTSGDGCSANCQSDETCGNAVIDFAVGETCDDGDTQAGDGCGSTCQIEICGNGIVEPGEICDDGNNMSGDGCRTDCLSDESCGNGIPDFAAGESCDDGNTQAGDGCGPTCLFEICGNGVLDPNELCDDGNNLPGDNCSPDCQSDETCGNGIVDLGVGESCDDGNAISGDGCSSECYLENCGNGFLDTGEACDDGNNASGDGCRADCLSDETCGNGVTDVVAGESCDDGNQIDGDGCSALCRLEYCGNGILDPGEFCDDGNTLSHDGCSPDCQSDETCGNSHVDPFVGEQCDDGNHDAGDGCGPTCLVERCGNAYPDPGELCDDGNNDAGDGCSPDCQSNETCGNGYVDTGVGEECDDGNLIGCDGCGATCLLEPTCPVNQLCCGGACIPSDENNCGYCGRTCPQNVPCFSGSCIEQGIIIVTEFHASPTGTDANEEYVEVYNTTPYDINLRNWVLKDLQDNYHQFAVDVWVPAFGHQVVGKILDTSQNCGVPTADAYNGNFNMGNNDEIVFEAGGIMVDTVDYSSVVVTGASANLDPDAYDHLLNDDMNNWCETTSNQMTCGDYGTPGQPNEQCP